MATVKKMRSAIPCVMLLGALIFGGCSQDDGPDIDDGRTAVAFTAGIEGASGHAGIAGRSDNGAPQTRTTGGGDTWTTTDKVGIFMLTTGGSLGTAGDILAGNKQYNVSAAGASSELVPEGGTPIYYPQSGNVDFVAYYPYTGTTGTGAGQITTDYKYHITVAGQTSEAAQNGLDVLYAKSTDVAKSKTTPVALTFNHVLSKVTLNVTLGDGLTGLSGSDITAVVLSGMPQTATLDLQDGTLAAGATGNFSALKAGAASGSAAATFSVLLIPQPTANAYSDRTAVFTVNGTPYTWTIPDGEIFAAGNHYTYPVTVKLNGITVGTPTITKWNTNPNGTGTAEKLPIEVVKIPAGTFLMGSSNGSNIGNTDNSGLNTTPAEPNRGSNETQHKVTLTKDFYMSKYQITNAQYAAFLNGKGVQYETNISNIWISGDGGKCTWGNNSGQIMILVHNWGVTYDSGVWKAQTGYENYPVVNVTWYGAVEYCAWLTQTTGFACSLPTEAEWEYACRGGQENHPFGIGTGYRLDNTLANFYWGVSWDWDGTNSSASTPNTGTYPGKTQEVGSYVANAWGLYDMHGNIFEWCSDWYGQYYGATDAAELTASVTTDPAGPESGSYRVFRGGSWGGYAQDCRSACRNSVNPVRAFFHVGFRVAVVP